MSITSDKSVANRPKPRPGRGAIRSVLPASRYLNLIDDAVRDQYSYLWWTCFVVSSLPFFGLLNDVILANLGANPVQAVEMRLGIWALRFLCLTLAITPIQKITLWPRTSHYRQLFGLYSFFYASLHVLAYLCADHALAWSIIETDIAESRFIWFGLLGYAVIFLLALTSSKLSVKILGKQWKRLHRLIYPAAIAVLAHYFWQLKGNLLEPIFYSALLFVLLAFRALFWLKKARSQRLS